MAFLDYEQWKAEQERLGPVKEVKMTELTSCEVCNARVGNIHNDLFDTPMCGVCSRHVEAILALIRGRTSIFDPGDQITNSLEFVAEKIKNKEAP
jgi:hypothetical protein